MLVRMKATRPSEPRQIAATYSARSPISTTRPMLAGAITAALFLAEFVEPACPWAHLDVMAWNLESRPGRPEGGEAMAMRALFAALTKRFCG